MGSGLAATGSGTQRVTLAWGCAEWTVKQMGGDSWISSSLSSVSVIWASPALLIATQQ